MCFHCLLIQERCFVAIDYGIVAFPHKPGFGFLVGFYAPGIKQKYLHFYGLEFFGHNSCVCAVLAETHPHQAIYDIAYLVIPANPVKCKFNSSVCLRVEPKRARCVVPSSNSSPALSPQQLSLRISPETNRLVGVLLGHCLRGSRSGQLPTACGRASSASVRLRCGLPKNH